jgi:predicted transcriptional regulator
MPSRPPDEDTNASRTLRLTIESYDEVRGRVLDAIAAVEEGDKEPEAVRAFESASELRWILTDRHLELIEQLLTETPSSISALAKTLDRNYPEVHEDIMLLADHWIVYIQTDGQANRPVIPYDSVKIEVDIRALDDVQGRDSATA